MSGLWGNARGLLFATAFPRGLPYNGRRSTGEEGGDVTVIYLDSVFFLNGLMDYLLCLVTARLAGVPLRRGRYALAAALGGSYAAAVFLPGLGFLAAPAAKAAAGVLLALAAFGGEKHLGRLTALFFGLSWALAGSVMALGVVAGSAVPAVNGIFYTDVDAKVLLIGAAGAYLLLTVVFRAAARHGVGGELLAVRVCVGGRTAELTALWDSGNSLREPGSGRPVLVLAAGALDQVLPHPVRQLVTPEALRVPAELLEPLAAAMPALRPRLTPYRAVGVDGGMLLTIRTDWIEICGVRRPGAPAALSPSALGTGYGALWGGEVRKGGGRHGQDPGMAAGDAGPAAAHPLHRRQRYPAAAPEPGAGGRAAGPSWGGAGPAGAD